MKHIIKYASILILFVFATNLGAQPAPPQGINYQGIAQNALGVALSNTTIGIKISIYSGSATGTLQWEETHIDTTNQFGLFTLVIGHGTNTGNGAAATFSSINWGSASHYLKVAMDVAGGSNYVDMDNTQLISVPYSLYAATAGSLTNPISINDLTDVDTTGTTIGKTLKWNGTNWIPAIDMNNDTALFAYNANHSLTSDTSIYALNAAHCDTALFAYAAGSAVYSNTSTNATNAAHSTYSDTAMYALNCSSTPTSDWHLTGNTGIVSTTNFIGTTNAADFVMKTNNTERARITSAGKLGIGTSTPTASVHFVGNDGFISQGTLGTGTAISIGSAGSTLFWYPKKGAFRAGAAAAPNWDDANIGLYSFAVGYAPKASAYGSIAIGQISQATDSCAIAMGYGPQASGKYSIAMGSQPVASGYASVALGRGPIASGYASTSLSYHGIASGNYSTVFGYYCTASGDNSVAMGYYASTNLMKGSFVFADNSSTNVTTSNTAPNQFMVKASGGTIFYSNSALTSGASLAPGGGAWASVSDRNKKEHFKTTDGDLVLNKIKDMEITSWNYKTQPSSIRHLGPMAQDFYAAFKLGESDTTITSTDIDGINMLAIQVLAKKTTELNSKAEEIEQLKLKVAKLEKEKAILEKRVFLIEKELNLSPLQLTVSK